MLATQQSWHLLTIVYPICPLSFSHFHLLCTAIVKKTSMDISWFGLLFNYMNLLFV